MDLIDNLYISLIQNFFRATILYLPNTLVDVIEDESDKETLYPHTNKAFIIERNGNNYFLSPEQQSLSHVSHKRIVLEDNMFKLLRYKDEATPSSFQFLLEKYLEQLKGCIYIFEWLYEHIDAYLVTSETDFKKTFELQVNILIEHLKSVKIRFGVQKEDKDVNTIAYEALEELEKIVTEKELSKAFSKTPAANSHRTSKKLYLKMLKQETMKKSEQSILESVFNVKF
ncbi:hypothetical protein [Winogradskyella wandonensis]|nr:hypothetical protein [Winogradskyella wandonensis]